MSKNHFLAYSYFGDDSNEYCVDCNDGDICNSDLKYWVKLGLFISKDIKIVDNYLIKKTDDISYWIPFSYDQDLENYDLYIINGRFLIGQDCNLLGSSKLMIDQLIKYLKL